MHTSRVVVVVDDGSTDRTAGFAQAAGADVLRLGQNRGKGAALNAGFQRARELRAAVAVTLDADAQHDAAEIPELVAPIVDGRADIVIGSRFLQTHSNIPRWRTVGQHTLTALINMTSGTTTSDSQSGFRAFSPKAIERLRFESRGLALESEMQFQIEREGLRLLEVPVSVQYLDGNKRNPVVHGLEVLDAVLSLVARRRPLAFLGVPGVMLVVCGLVLGLWVVNRVDTSHVVPFGTAVLSSMFIISGLVLALIGVVLNSLEYFLSRMQQDLRDVLQGSNAALLNDVVHHIGTVDGREAVIPGPERQPLVSKQ